MVIINGQFNTKHIMVSHCEQYNESGTFAGALKV